LEIDFARSNGIAIGKDIFPIDFDLVENEDRVSFVKARCQWAVEFAVRVASERLARPKLQSLSIAADCTGYRIRSMIACDRLQVPYPDFVRKQCSRRQRLHPTEHDAIIVFADHAQPGAFIRLVRIRGLSVGKNRIDHVSVPVLYLTMVLDQILRERPPISVRPTLSPPLPSP